MKYNDILSALTRADKRLRERDAEIERLRAENERLRGEVPMREIPITLPTLVVATLKVPEKMSKVEYDDLMGTLKKWEPALVQATPGTSGQDESADPDDT